MPKVLIIDTSVMCVWLNVPSMEECGPDDDKWDSKRVEEKIENEQKEHTTFVLPMATLIETGNHITNSTGNSFDLASKFAGYIQKAADEETPWAAFNSQGGLWSSDGLKELAENWPKHAHTLTIGDMTIKNVAEYYAQMGYEVELFTGDLGLKSYQPEKPVHTPRRRRK